MPCPKGNALHLSLIKRGKGVFLAIICFAVTPKVRGTRGNKAKAGLICGIIGIIGSVILITVFVVNILLSSDFQNEMKEFNTHYDTYIDENDDSI